MKGKQQNNNLLVKTILNIRKAVVLLECGTFIKFNSQT